MPNWPWKPRRRSRVRQTFDKYIDEMAERNAKLLDEEVGALVILALPPDAEVTDELRQELNKYLRYCMMAGSLLALDNHTDDLSISSAWRRCVRERASVRLSVTIPIGDISEKAVRRGIVHHNRTFGQGESLG